MKIGRVITTYKCPKDCELCCNKNWKGKPAVKMKESDYKKYDMIVITGGEPLLFPGKIIDLCERIREENKNTTIILYTAYVKKFPGVLFLIRNYLDGITVTLHDNEDVEPFIKLNNAINSPWSDIRGGFSFRLNIFKGISLPVDIDLSMWKVKSGIEWIKDCPLPKDEELLELEELWH